MRKTTVCLVAMLMCAGVSSFGQSNGLPQWKVVKDFHVTNGTIPIPNTVVFTADDNNLYRFSEYLAGPFVEGSNAGFQASLLWTDRRGDSGQFETDIVLDGIVWSTVNPSLFSPKAGTEVLFHVMPFGSLPPDATYDLAFTIEKLTR